MERKAAGSKRERAGLAEQPAVPAKARRTARLRRHGVRGGRGCEGFGMLLEKFRIALRAAAAALEALQRKMSKTSRPTPPSTKRAGNAPATPSQGVQQDKSSSRCRRERRLRLKRAHLAHGFAADGLETTFACGDSSGGGGDAAAPLVAQQNENIKQVEEGATPYKTALLGVQVHAAYSGVAYSDNYPNSVVQDHRPRISRARGRGYSSGPSYTTTAPCSGGNGGVE